ncbi:hypothetical protein DFJ63DRAFT_27565 [Scheffersomyces coipomensis]|uniref:uncharacterized protein n=1 Tax=Scheffersomyces coipomensis TaxID=1788519 RepID=UPI00315D36E4
MSQEDQSQSQSLQQSLDQLATWEKEMSSIEKDIEIYRIKQTQTIYAKRQIILSSIPKFWYIVLAENDDFADYISIDDLKYLEFIEDIYIEYPLISTDTYKDFSITITFNGGDDDDLIPQQKVTKHFQTIIQDGEERLISKSVDVEWPKELNKINPKLIKSSNKGNKNWSSGDKKNYRLGMKSFFAWFGWTGEKPGKEFKNGEDLTRLIVDDLYLNALKYYILALPNGDDDDDDEDEEDEEDSSEGEELDLSGEDEEEDGEEDDEEEEEEEETSNKRNHIDDNGQSKKHKH